MYMGLCLCDIYIEPTFIVAEIEVVLLNPNKKNMLIVTV